MKAVPPSSPTAATPLRPRVSASRPAMKMPMPAGVLVMRVNRVMPVAE